MVFPQPCAFEGQVHVFAGRVKIVSLSSCRTGAILKYFCPLMNHPKFIISNQTDKSIRKQKVKALITDPMKLQDNDRRLILYVI